MSAARVLFVVAAIYFGWWSLRGEWSAVLAAFGQVAIWQWLISIGLVLAGLLCTGVVWARVLAGYGYRLPVRTANSVFFIGQLGKYIPGSVWALAAQGQMARRFHVPVRTTVATGLIFLYWNVVTATLLGAVLTLLGFVNVNAPPWMTVSAVVVAVVALMPNTVTALANKLAGTDVGHHTRWRDVGMVALMMLVTWGAYGMAVVSIAPDNSNDGTSKLAIPTAIAAFSVAYVLGVLVPFAPAGFGIREASLTYLLTPTLGLATAAAVALVTRALHTIADFGIAAGAWAAGRNVGAHSMESDAQQDP